MTAHLFDYSMSNLFVAETRERPYRTGRRFRPHPLRRLSLSYINNLRDEEFLAYCRNGCRLPSAGPDVQSDLIAELRAALRECETDVRALRAELRVLRQLVARTAQNQSTAKGGLGVPPRP